MTRLDRRRDTLGDIAHLTSEIARELAPAVNVLAGAARTGYPTTGGDGHVSGGATPDPTLGTATSGREGRSPTAAHPDLDVLDHALRTMLDAGRTALAIVHRHTPRRTANPDTPNDPGCASCIRDGHWTERFRGDLCNWCYKHRGLHPEGQKADMPALYLVRLHLRGRDTIHSGDLRKAGVPL